PPPLGGMAPGAKSRAISPRRSNAHSRSRDRVSSSSRSTIAKTRSSRRSSAKSPPISERASMSKRQYFGTQPTTLTERRRGYAVIRDPLTNKSSAFLPAERTALGLHGLLPPQTHTMDQQMKRAYANVEKLADPLDKYMALAALQDRNEHLFYRVLMEHLEQLMPIVYTPTVGAATRHFSQVFQRGRGVWISPDQRGRIAEVL